MKSIIFLILFYCQGNDFVVPPLKEIRSMHQKAAGSESDCKKLLTLLTPYTEKNEPVLMGYRASATMMMAKHVFNPVSKLSYFKKGRKMLETVIASNIYNIELRFLRFAIQTNVPSFLNYDSNIEEDKNFLLVKTPGLSDVALKKMIYDYLLQSGKLTATQKTTLQ